MEVGHTVREGADVRGVSPGHGTPAVHDPVRAHGAWVFLFASAGAGALVGARRGVEPALLAATAFAGGFVLASAFVSGARRRGRRMRVGAGVACGATATALVLGAEPAFLAVAAAASAAAVAAVAFARRGGLLSVPAILAGLGAIALAGPAAAVAGGASLTRGALLLALTWPFFAWRTLAVAAPLAAGDAWDRAELRARGLREAAFAAAWVFAVAVLLRVWG